MNPSDSPNGPGLRGRFRAAAPPAPVPEPRPAAGAASETPDEPTEDRSRLTAAPGNPVAEADTTAGERGPGDAGSGSGASGSDDGREGTSDADVVRSTGSMAIATLFSRITGFLRNVLIGASLGPAISSAFNTANTLPNLITEIVLGAVLTSLVVPVLVRAEKEDADHGSAFVRRLFTLAFSLLGVVTVLAVVGAPLLTRLTLGSDGEVNVTQSTSFAFLVLPQILFYGLFSLFMAVLNTKGVFRPGAWAPVANNVVSITVLLLYRFLPGGLDPNAPSPITDPHVLLLGLGTTAGVVVQMLILIPPLKRAGVDLRPLWGIDERLKAFGGMAMAIIVYVAISQAGWVITTNIASASSAAAPNIYQQHWLLLQVPYGIIGVTLLTALMPRLSRNAADGDDKGVVRDLTLATKLTFIALIPVVLFFTAFGRDIGIALFHYGAFEREASELLGLTLSFSAFTLIPYATVLLHLRVFYAREEAWTPTWIIAGITATKVVLSVGAPMVASSPHRVVILLGAANGFGFIAGAFIGWFLLRRKLGPLGTGSVLRTSVWALASSLVGVAAALLTGWLIDVAAGPLLAALGSIGQLLRLGVVGVIFLAATGVVLSFSKLPEVQNLGALVQRVPGVRRLVRVDEERGLEVGEPTVREISEQYLVSDSFAATPVPPPMSAGVVRGPRLVPGASVDTGRYRLLAEHGSATGARFWEAKERATGRRVALVFVDTSGMSPLAPATPAAAAGAAAEVTRRTRKLAGLGHPSIAPNVKVSAYRNGCLVVADWVEGSPLKTVAEEGGADPRAAAYALSPLADAVGRAHEAGTPLGLDNWSRIRINTSGQAVLAFPAVLADASREEDTSAVASALGLLVDTDSAPEDVVGALQAAHEGETDPIELGERLRRAGLGETDEEPAELEVHTDEAPTVEQHPGFGERGLTRKGTGVLAVLVFGAVVGIAVAATYLAGVLGDGEGDAPVSRPGTSQTQGPDPLPLVQSLESAETLPDGENAHAAVDGDTSTSVTLQRGEGLELTLQAAVPLQTVVVTQGDGTVGYRVEQVAEDAAADGSGDGDGATGSEGSEAEGSDAAREGAGEQLAAGELRGGRNVIELQQAAPSAGVRIWFDGDVTVSEVRVVGQRG
ncbi:murein biosynthesis integral membrane protein MurJ [Corynebacterium frankenforstense]